MNDRDDVKLGLRERVDDAVRRFVYFAQRMLWLLVDGVALGRVKRGLLNALDDASNHPRSIELRILTTTAGPPLTKRSSQPEFFPHGRVGMNAAGTHVFRTLARD